MAVKWKAVNICRVQTWQQTTAAYQRGLPMEPKLKHRSQRPPAPLWPVCWWYRQKLSRDNGLPSQPWTWRPRVPSLMYSHENIQSFNKQPQTKQTSSRFVFRGSFPSTNYPFIFIPFKELLFFIAVNYFFSLHPLFFFSFWFIWTIKSSLCMHSDVCSVESVMCKCSCGPT